MKRLHGLILRTLPGPILGWLGTLMFLLLMQFLIKYLPDLAGKELPFFVVVELIAYNLAYMVVLAVPMSVLIGTMMVFSRLTESRAYVVAKSSGISPIQLIWPTLVIGLFLTVGMTYFNNMILPEANFRARNLWSDIREKRPGFELQEGVFYDGLDEYSILVQRISGNADRLEDVLVYDYTDEERYQTVIKAREGHLRAMQARPELVLTLLDGEVHRMRSASASSVAERYERLAFERYQMRLDLSEFAFERGERDAHRSDRTMRTIDMIHLVDSLQRSVDASRDRLIEEGRRVVEGPRIDLTAVPDTALSAAPAPGRIGLVNLERTDRNRVVQTALSRARSTRTLVDETRRNIEWESQRTDRFRVEIHKKYSIAIACIIFVLIGAPLGLSVRRGGLGAVGALSTGIFLFYWVTLVQGEKLADRGLLTPWVGMWAANIVMVTLGLWLMLYVSKDLRATPPLRKRLLKRFQRSN
ncbi:MAG: LptF/LptG family permease [Rhodothermales bacterium]